MSKKTISCNIFMRQWYQLCWYSLLVFVLAAGMFSCRGSANQGSLKSSEPFRLTSVGKPAILEIVNPAGGSIKAGELMSLTEKDGKETVFPYQWKNHLVVYGNIESVNKLSHTARTLWPNHLVKLYTQPFYEFHKEQCRLGTIAKEWEHALLTANLVEDTLLQKEYLAYHAQQQTKWPEVAKGFCHANFQQLLLFKEGRQLMLIISTPKDSSLAVLNPRTVENNPKMKEWNTLMQKYQEGIAGTQRGEVWVFLEPVKRH
jgi:L-rhamnose mutarotase